MQPIPEPTTIGPVFLVLSFVTLAGAVAAMSLRNLVHCVLCLVVTFGGLSALYLRLDAEFVGLAQIFVYVGAVAILIVFAILLTRSGEVLGGVFSTGWLAGLTVAALVAVTLVVAIGRTDLRAAPESAVVKAPVRQVGDALMKEYVVPLEVTALLLTGALIGAAILAMPDRRSK